MVVDCKLEKTTTIVGSTDPVWRMKAVRIEVAYDSVAGKITVAQLDARHAVNGDLLYTTSLNGIDIIAQVGDASGKWTDPASPPRTRATACTRCAGRSPTRPACGATAGVPLHAARYRPRRPDWHVRSRRGARNAAHHAGRSARVRHLRDRVARRHAARVAVRAKARALAHRLAAALSPPAPSHPPDAPPPPSRIQRSRPRRPRRRRRRPRRRLPPRPRRPPRRRRRPRLRPPPAPPVALPPFTPATGE